MHTDAKAELIRSLKMDELPPKQDIIKGGGKETRYSKEQRMLILTVIAHYIVKNNFNWCTDVYEHFNKTVSWHTILWYGKDYFKNSYNRMASEGGKEELIVLVNEKLKDWIIRLEDKGDFHTAIKVMETLIKVNGLDKTVNIKIEQNNIWTVEYQDKIEEIEYEDRTLPAS